MQHNYRQPVSTPVATRHTRHMQYMCTIYAFIIYEKVQSYRDSRTKYFIDRYLPCTTRIEWLTACHICLHSQSRISTFTLRLSVFDWQSSLVTEPVQVKGGQLTADRWIGFLYFVSQHQLLKKASKCWQALVEFAFVYKLFSLKRR